MREAAEQALGAVHAEVAALQVVARRREKPRTKLLGVMRATTKTPWLSRGACLGLGKCPF